MRGYGKYFELLIRECLCTCNVWDKTTAATEQHLNFQFLIDILARVIKILYSVQRVEAILHAAIEPPPMLEGQL